MTTVSILSFPSELGDGTFRAVAGEHRSSGRTAGEALDALAGQLTPDELTTLVVVQHHQPDRLFTADQRNRLNQLMERWRSARDDSGQLPDDEQTELDDLVEAELQAAMERTSDIAKELGA